MKRRITDFFPSRKYVRAGRGHYYTSANRSSSNARGRAGVRRFVAAANKFGRSRSKTKTKTKRTKRKGKGGFTGGDDFAGYKLVFGGPRPKFNWNQARKRINNIQGTGIVACTSGRQFMQTVMFINSLSDIVSLQNQLRGGSATQYSQDFMIRNCKAEMLITNNANTKCELIIYNLMCRRDTDQSAAGFPDTAWIDGVIANFEGDGTTPISGAAGNAGFYGDVPQSSKLFNEYWKIKKRSRFLLDQYDTVRYTVNLKMDKIFHAAKLGDATPPNVFAGWTYACMFLLRGGQVETDSTASTTTTTCSAQVDCCFNKHYTTAATLNSDTVFTTNTSFNTVGVAAHERFGEDILQQVVTGFVGI